MERILVTPRSLTEHPHPAIGQLQTAGFEVIFSAPGLLPSEDELVGLVFGCVGWLAGVEPVTPAVIDAAKDLRVISRNGVGVDNLPLPLLAERGIAVVTANGANAAGVTELTLGLMLASLRHIPMADAGIKAGQWPRHRGAEIRGRTVGIVGCGAIGGDVARLVCALGARVLAFDPLSPALGLPPERFAWAPIEAILADADIVSLHCPMPADGRPLIDGAAIAAMRQGAILVNTARAALVDETAVIRALNEGRLGTYATDVFPQEPPKCLDLAGHPKVIATSHIGGFTRESVDRAVEMAVANLLQELEKPAKAYAD